MISVLVAYSYGYITLEVFKSLLADPCPQKFHNYGFKPAPAGGLFLEKVVYDERSFLYPVPYMQGLWSGEDLPSSG